MSWLETAILHVREATNEPVSKYSDARVIYYLEQACAVELGDIFAQADGPNTVLWELSLQSGVRHYVRPPHVATIHAIFKANDQYERQWFVAPRGRSSCLGPGISFDNNMITVEPTVQRDEVLNVWHSTNGEIKLCTGPVASDSTASCIKLDTPTLGVRDPRAYGYAGATVRVTATDGRIEDRHVSSSTFDGTTHAVCAVPDFTIPVTGGTYEMVPAFGSLFLSAISYQASIAMMAPDSPIKRIARIADMLKSVRRQLRQNTSRLNGITGKRFQGDSWLARIPPLDGWRGRRA